MSQLFGRRHTLILYSFIYGPERGAPCPMCTHLLDSVNGAARHVGQRASLYVMAKSPGRASVGRITFNFSRRMEIKMKKFPTIAVALGLLLSVTAGAQNNRVPEAMKKIEPLPRDLEIQLALSALPSHLRENATVYVLNLRKGFEVARKGTNGFHALVARTGDDAFRGSWPLTEYRDDILYPIAFDSAGAKEPMRVFFDAAEMQAKGTPSGELKRIIKDQKQAAKSRSEAAQKADELFWQTFHQSAHTVSGGASRLLPAPRAPQAPEETRGDRVASTPVTPYEVPHPALQGATA
jgi:hypothetical protein